MEKPKTMDRRTFMKYSLGASGGLLMGTELTGLLEAQEKKEPEKGARVQKSTFTITNRSDFTEMGRIIVTAFKEIGLEADLETLELGAFLSKAVGKHEVDMAGMSWTGSMDRIDPSSYLTDFFHSRNAGKNGRNYQHYRNPEYDTVCDESNQEMDRE